MQTITLQQQSGQQQSERVTVDRAKPSQRSTPAASTLIQLQNVAKLYDTGSLGLSGINLSMVRGDFLLVTGPSGAGKTTLLKLLYGAERPSRGSVLVNNQAVHLLQGDLLARLRRQIGVVFQDYKLLANRTVTENVAFVLWAQGYRQAAIERRLLPTLKLVGLKHKASCLPGQLSGGEQQRVSLARAIVGMPPLILADEPTGNLDPDNARQVIKILQQLNQIGLTIIMTTHDEQLIRRLPYPAVRLQQGRLHWLRRSNSRTL
ncbi:MAG: cell division ATP-binding protein FtsE [Cyanobacteria bacterium P01_H01_bin.121]